VEQHELIAGGLHELQRLRSLRQSNSSYCSLTTFALTTAQQVASKQTVMRRCCCSSCRRAVRVRIPLRQTVTWRIDLLVPCSPPRQFIDAVSLLVGHNNMLQCFSFALRVDVISFVRSLVDAGPVSFHT